MDGIEEDYTASIAQLMHHWIFLGQTHTITLSLQQTIGLLCSQGPKWGFLRNSGQPLDSPKQSNSTALVDKLSWLIPLQMCTQCRAYMAESTVSEQKVEGD
ncbi:hypothetical protein AMTR_s00045p00194510 [Amborella trichopoda]|uniref:Uncharacterized protein n=1 Tax=Amborella trichopoda TaxID=13333 RepID=W1P5G5_AMBTC|nr:hypothetical protein AMTR_s00045p00194510 [Amborella trichopoda]